jgi:hypothetical protein
MSSIVMRQTEATIHTLETFKRNGKFARHFVDVGEKVDWFVLCRASGIGGWVLLALQRSL